MTHSITHAHRLAALGLWVLAAAATAVGPASAPLDPADDRVPVPATRYEPMPGTSPSPMPNSSPSDNWKTLNREVGLLDSMSLTIDIKKSTPDPHAGHAEHAGHAAAPAAPTPKPAPQSHIHMEHK